MSLEEYKVQIFGAIAGLMLAHSARLDSAWRDDGYNADRITDEIKENKRIIEELRKLRQDFENIFCPALKDL